MSDVLMATAYQLRHDPKQQRIMKPYPPLATLYAAALLQAAGFDVSLFDSMFVRGERAFAAALARHKPHVVVLYEDSFNWLTKMCLSRMREAAFRMADQARRRGAIVLAAGPDASDEPALYLEHVDAVLPGEAEFSLQEALNRLQEGGPERLQKMPGSLTRDAEGRLLRGPRRPLIEDLDVLPRPAWSLVDLEPYRRAWKRRHGYFSLNQITTRGCPFKCNWCAKPVYGDAYTTRSPENLIDELRYMQRTLKPDHIWYADDILGLKKSWLRRFSTLAEQEKIQIPFTCQTRVDLMTESNVAALRRAGCVEAWVGAESGAQSILDAMDKGTRVVEIEKAAQNLRNAGIRVAFFIQLGYPGEGWREIQATRALLARCLPDEIGISVSYPLPGTTFYEKVHAQLHDKDRWEHSDDLDPLFPGEYPREMYQHLHRMMHSELKIRQAFQSIRTFTKKPKTFTKKNATVIAKLPLHIARFCRHRGSVEYTRRTTHRKSFASAFREAT